MTMDIIGPLATAAATGGAGAATGSKTMDVDAKGLLFGVYVKYEDSPPATSDVVIATVGTSPVAPAQTILTLTNKNTDGWFYPRLNPHDVLGNSLAGIYDYFPIADKIIATLSQANNNDYITFWLAMWRR